MSIIVKRLLSLPDMTKNSCFLWGPRRTGKSWWIRHELPHNLIIDLLKSDVFAEYSTRPSLLRERLIDQPDSPQLVIIDEIQKCPQLLDDIHWMIENTKTTFLLTGSSARKLRRAHANLLGGRARRRELRPLCFPEVDEYNPERLVLTGLLPPHYLSEDYRDDLRSYVADYLKEEISQEGLVRNLPAFAEFLRVAALTSSELINYTNIAREVGVSAKVVRGYFDVLEDTLLGFRVPPWRKARKRRLVETEKFYLFDVGLTNYLARREPKPRTPEFGKSFEHLIAMELFAWRAYRNPELEITFWRTANKQEVDFILDDKRVAIEIKGSPIVHDKDLQWLHLLCEDGPVERRIVVSFETSKRLVNDSFGRIEILPWRMFLEELWQTGLVK